MGWGLGVSFNDLPDPRTGPNAIHKLHDLIVLAVKENQPTLHAAVKGLLDELMLENFAGVEHGFVETKDDGHGRIETRKV